MVLPRFITRLKDSTTLIENIGPSTPPETGQSGQDGLKEGGGDLHKHDGPNCIKPQDSDQQDRLPTAGETIEKPSRLRVVVTERKRVEPPIRLSVAETVIDPQRFLDTTLADMEAYVAAENRGSKHWVRDLLEEKLEHLRLCGIEVEMRFTEAHKKAGPVLPP